MNAVADTIDPQERIVVIEDTTELALPGHHVTRLEARLPNALGHGALTIRDLLRQALHMRPDRLLIGEVRGEEALDLLQALTSGHDGSMTTLHASHPADVLDRLVTMALLGRAELSPVAVERQVRSAIQMIVQMDRLSDGARVVTSLCEVRPIGQEPAVVELFARTLDPSTPRHSAWRVAQDSAPPRQVGVGLHERGHPHPLAATGQRPAFLERLRRRGLPLPERLFSIPTRRHHPSPPLSPEGRGNG
jgi:pilus assembly protein CpaF